MSTTPMNSATADLRVGKISNVLSNSWSVVLSPAHMSAPAFLAVMASLDPALAGWLALFTGCNVVGAGSFALSAD